MVSEGSAEAAGGEGERCLVLEVPWGLRFFLNAGASIVGVWEEGERHRSRRSLVGFSLARSSQLRKQDR